MSEGLSAPGLLTLATWLSPGYPVGAFAWSHGLERAVADGEVRDADSLREWLAALLEHGSGRSDAVLLARAWRDPEDEEVAELARALQPGAERRAESEGQGAAFAAVTGAVRGHSGAAAPYPVAVGRAAAREGLPLRETLALYLHAFAANLVSAAVRLVPLGQTEGQGALAALAPVCEAVAEDAMAADPEDLGGACLRADLASLKHETLQTRLFRS